ncbi:MAG: hypothetical protein QXO22_07230 [Thermosphaera sp.]
MNWPRSFRGFLSIDELSNDELLELYDAIDEAYNSIIATYLERIVKDPTKRNMEELVKLAIFSIKSLYLS